MPKTETTGPEVCLQSIHDVIRERQELATEAAQIGVYAYAYGGCEAMIGEAIMLALETPEEAAQAICERLEGHIVGPEQLDDAIRHFFFMYGIYKSFLARTAGKYCKEAADE